VHTQRVVNQIAKIAGIAKIANRGGHTLICDDLGCGWPSPLKS
jgi:hypothetical protein